MSTRDLRESHGPFTANQLKSGDRYELSNGHAIYCAPTGGDGARRTGTAFEVIDTDPDVDDAGVDPGFTPNGRTLRAPDVAVGVPDQAGWINGVPPLAVEYAGSGQDEPELQRKIVELLTAGTQLIWVVRLVGLPRVEVYAPNTRPVVKGIGEELDAPGILRNRVPVAALFDRSAAHEVTLRNLLQRRGYADLDDVLARGQAAGREEGRAAGREEGRAAGREEGRAEALMEVLRARGLAPTDAQAARIRACVDGPTLSRWLVAAVTVTTVEDVLAS